MYFVVVTVLIILLFFYYLFSIRFVNQNVKNTALPSTAVIMIRALTSSFVKREGRLPSGNPFPRIQLQQTRIIDKTNVEKYDQICTFESSEFWKSEKVPLCYMEALCMKLMSTTISLPQFPLSGLGLIHIRNLITQYEDIIIGQKLDFESNIGEHRITERGIEVDIVCTASVGNVVSWKAISTLLSRGKSVPKKQPPEETKQEETQTSRFKVRENTGRRYAAVSGDYNPHHLYALTAKFFGFHKPIAHGLWSLASCMKELTKLPQYPKKYPITVECSFKRPLFMPGEVVFSYKVLTQDNGISFGLYDKEGKIPHLVGQVLTK